MSSHRALVEFKRLSASSREVKRLVSATLILALSALVQTRQAHAQSDPRWIGPIARDADVRLTLRASSVEARDAADVVSWVLVGSIMAAPVMSSAFSWRFADPLQQSQSLWSGLSVAIPYGLTAAIGFSAKYFIARERPYATMMGLTVRCHQASPPRECAGDRNASFPSLHSALGFVSASVGCIYGSPLACGFYGAGASMGATLRIVADKHYLSDVVAGSLLGITVAVLSAILVPNPAQTESYIASPGREIAVRAASMSAGMFLGSLGVLALTRW